MKIGIIARPNQKGQIVIPKPLREALKIKPNVPLNLVQRNGGIYLQPVEDFVPSLQGENAYLKILEKTQGSWKGENLEKLSKKRRQIELTASKKRKQSW